MIQGAYDGPETILQFRVRENGVLVPLTPAAVPAGTGAYNINIDSSNRFAYVTGGPEDSLFQFKIQDNGTLASLSPPIVKTMPKAEMMVIDAETHFAYVRGQGGNVLRHYRIQPNGTLIPLSPIVVAKGALLWSVLCPRPSFLYILYGVSMKDDNNTAVQDFIMNYGVPLGCDVYRIAPDGTAQKISSLAVPKGQNLVFDPLGRYAYIDAHDDTLLCYTIQPNGSLKRTGSVHVSTTSVRNDPIKMTFDPQGRFAYLLHRNHQEKIQLSQYRVARGGLLKPLSPEDVPTLGDAWDITLDPTGRFLYTSNVYPTRTDQIGSRGFTCCYRLKTDGTLQQVGQKVDTGYNVYLPAFSPDGRFVYFQASAWLNEDFYSTDRLGFRIAADGHLVPLSPPRYHDAGVDRQPQFVTLQKRK